MHDAEERVARLTKQTGDLAANWSMAPVVEALQAMRGVAFGVAVTVVAEVGDFSRFDNPRQLMSYLGLTPSEHSSGAAIRRGGITKAGNALARRVLIEGAWTYRMQARVSRKLHDRLEGLPQLVRDIAWKAQVRLCARYRRLAATGKGLGMNFWKMSPCCSRSRVLRQRCRVPHRVVRGEADEPAIEKIVVELLHQLPL